MRVKISDVQVDTYEGLTPREGELIEVTFDGKDTVHDFFKRYADETMFVVVSLVSDDTIYCKLLKR